jgi:hypothetical protein
MSVARARALRAGGPARDESCITRALKPKHAPGGALERSGERDGADVSRRMCVGPEQYRAVNGA